ncbi:hypothetical protein ACH5RR_040266 [Cinchona calisaya]|uniref:Uncharacterized protein n=1 Tax=Cinchona calisaya TaxID=153742 RepID=A0ABD2XRN9_9GENT
MSSSQAILAFIATVLLNFLQIKFQAKDQSPFETHPKTIFVAISSLLLYCLSFDAYLTLPILFPPDNNNNRLRRFYGCLVHTGMAFFGPLSLACISSPLFPESIAPLLFSLSIFYSFCQLLGFSSQVKSLWNFLRAAIMGILFTHHHQHHHHRHGSRRGRLVSVDEIDILPLPPV